MNYKNQNKFSEKEIQQIKEKYIAGTKIELIKMKDPQAVPPHTKGKVMYVDDIGTIHINWETGSTLGLIIGVDEFQIMKDEKLCPICGKAIIGYPALSRKDNKTEICSNCGTIEALEEFEKYNEMENKNEQSNN